MRDSFVFLHSRWFCVIFYQRATPDTTCMTYLFVGPVLHFLQIHFFYKYKWTNESTFVSIKCASNRFEWRDTSIIKIGKATIKKPAATSLNDNIEINRDVYDEDEEKNKRSNSGQLQIPRPVLINFWITKIVFEFEWTGLEFSK